MQPRSNKRKRRPKVKTAVVSVKHEHDEEEGEEEEVLCDIDDLDAYWREMHDTLKLKIAECRRGQVAQCILFDQFRFHFGKKPKDSVPEAAALRMKECKQIRSIAQMGKVLLPHT